MTPFIIAWSIVIPLGAALGMFFGWPSSDSDHLRKAKFSRVKTLTGNNELAKLATFQGKSAGENQYTRWLRGSLVLEPSSDNFQLLKFIVREHKKAARKEVQEGAGIYASHHFKKEGLHKDLLQLIAQEEATASRGVASQEFQAHVRHSLDRIGDVVKLYGTNWLLSNNEGVIMGNRYGDELQGSINFARACNSAWVPSTHTPAIAETAYRKLIEGSGK